jgi:hypothetical protein
VPSRDVSGYEESVRQQMVELERALDAQVSELVAAQEQTTCELRTLQERVQDLQVGWV